MPITSITADPGQAALGLAGALIPDPSKLAQANYMGAHSRQADATALKTQAETGDLQATAAAKARLPELLARAAQQPSTETAAAAAAAGIQAGYTVKDIFQGALAANQMATGSNKLPQAVVDGISSVTGTQTFTSTATGQQRDIAGQRDRSLIAIQPQLQERELDRRKYADTRTAYTDAGGNTQYLAPGQTPGPEYMPTDQAVSAGNARVSALPSLLTAQTNAGKQVPYGVSDPSAPNGQSITWRRSDEPAPKGAIPIDPTNHIPTAGLTSLFGRGAPISGAPSQTNTSSEPAPQSAAAAAGGTTVRPGPAFGPVASVFSATANTGGLAKADSGDMRNDPRITASLNARVAGLNKNENSGLFNLDTRNFQLDPKADAAIRARVAQLVVDRNSASTWQRPEAAVEQAWAEIGPTLVRDRRGTLNPKDTSSWLALPEKSEDKPKGPDKVPAKGAESRVAAAPPSPLSATLAGGVPGAPPAVRLGGPQDAPMPAQAAPAPVQAAPMPVQAASAPVQAALPPPQAAPMPPQAAPAVAQAAPAPVQAALPPQLAAMLSGGQAGPAPAQAAPAAPQAAQTGTQTNPEPAPAAPQRVPGKFYVMNGHVVQWGVNGMWLPPARQPAMMVQD